MGFPEDACRQVTTHHTADCRVVSCRVLLDCTVCGTNTHYLSLNYSFLHIVVVYQALLDAKGNEEVAIETLLSSM